MISPAIETWLEERKGYIGGSDLAPILGKSKYKTALDVFLLKTGQKEEDQEEARKREMGVLLEPGIRTWAARELNRTILPNRKIVDPKHPFLVANVDGELDAKTGIEIKTMDFSTRDQWGEPGTDEVPIDYLIQTNWYCGIAGWERCVVVRFDRGTTKIEYYQVPFDKELFELCRNEAINMWVNHICKGVPPDPTAKDSANIIYLFPQPTFEILVSDPETDEKASRMAEIKATLKPLEAEYEALKSWMAVKIGPAAGVETMSGKFTLSRLRGNVAWKDVATALNANPELCEKHRGKPYTRLNTPF
jgi:putative phage-type endonuclease